MYTDHKGQTYSSFNSMCKAYKQSLVTVKGRLARGFSLQQALETRGYLTENSVGVTDHRGMWYPDHATMCNAYNKATSTVTYRLNQGCTLQESLENNHLTEVIDHKGQTHSSFTSMCKAYNQDATNVTNRLNAGNTLQDSLEKGRITEVTDYKGQTYSSFNIMCKEYKQDAAKVKVRLETGVPLEHALEMQEFSGVVDHKGTEYSSFAEMCRAYNKLQVTVSNRLNRGIPLAEALEKSCKKEIVPLAKIVDHNGQEYPSFYDMCKAYNQKDYQVTKRLENGKTLEEALLPLATQIKINYL